MWAPLLDAAGHRLGHWESMTQVRPGDSVLHYAHGAVRAVEIVHSVAELELKPASLPDQWDRDGRRVRVAMTDVGSHQFNSRRSLSQGD